MDEGGFWIPNMILNAQEEPVPAPILNGESGDCKSNDIFKI